MAVELATAYVSLVVDTKSIPAQIDKALKSSGSAADKAGSDMGSRMSSALGKTLKTGALAAAGAAGAGIATALTKGWQRLSAIDDAQGKLVALGNTSQQTAKILDNAMTSVKGTSFGFGDAASLAGTAVAAGVESGKDLTRYLSLVADAATIANVPLSEMGQIFNKVQTGGRAYTMEITQLADRGIPIWQWLQKEMGATQEELRDLVADGKVTSADYLNAIEKNIGGAATAATTVSSQWANTMAAMGRLGAKALEPTFGRLSGWLGTGIEGIDAMTDRVGPLAEALDAKVFEEWGPKLADAFEALRNSDLGGESIERLKGVFEDLFSTAEALWPSVRTIGESLAEAAAATGISTWQILLSVLESVAPILDATLVPALQATASLMESNQGAVTGLVLAFAAFRTLPMLMTPITRGLATMSTSLMGARTNAGNFGGSVRDSMRWLRQANPQMTTFGAAARTAGSMAASGFGAAGGAIRGVVSAVGGLSTIGVTAAIMAIPALIGEAKKWDSQAELTTKAADNVSLAQRRMGEAFIESAGKVDDAVFAQVNRQAEVFLSTLEQVADSGPGALGVFVGGFKDIAGWFRGEAQAGTDAYRELEERAESAKSALTTLADLDIGTDEIARALAGGQGSWDSFISSLERTGEVSDETIDALQGMREEFEDQRDAAKRLSPGIVELSDHFATLADTASSAEEKSSALKSTLDLLAGGAPDLNEAMDGYNKLVRDTAEATADVWDQTKGWADELIGDTGVDTATENGAKLRESILDIRNATADVVAAGGDLDATLESNDEMFRRLSESTGVSVEELMRLAELEGYLPEVFELTTRIQGAEDVESQLAAIGTYIDQFPDKPLVLNTEGLEGAIDKLREFGFEVEDIGNGQVKINIDDAEAIGKLDGILAELGIVADVEIFPGVDLDTAMFDAKADTVDDMIAYLHTQEPSPEADLIITKLQEGKEVSVRELADLASKTADPEVYLKNLQKLLEDAGIASRAIDDAARRRTAEIAVQFAVDYGAARNANPGFVGPLAVTPRADGGIQNLPGQATIQPGRGAGLIQWAEGETGGEAFIPLAQSKRGRSTQILADVAQRFGLRLESYADGGIRRALDAVRSVTGNEYVWGGTGPTGFDCSGLVGWAQQIVMGMTAVEAAGRRLYTTYSLLGGSTAGLQPGAGPAGTAFVVGVSQEHMAATLAGNNIEAGGAHGTSSLNGPAVGAYDSQFSSLFHLPNSMVDGGTEGMSLYGAGYVQQVEWTEKDELDLEDARVKVLQAQEARDKIYANEKKTDADRQAADIKVQRAELKVKDLEAKRDGKGGASQIVTPAPELSGEMDADTLTIRRAEIALLDAQLARDKVYSDPESTSLDKEKADLQVFDARNSLQETKDRIAEDSEEGADGSNKDGWTTETLRDRVASYGSQVAGILFDSALEIFGIESRWLDIPWPKYELESEKKKPKKGKEKDDEKKEEAFVPPIGSFSREDLSRQLGFNPEGGMPEWFAKHLKPLPLKVYDTGGWLKPNEMAINLSNKPEPIFNSPAQLTKFMGQNAEMLEPAMAGGAVDYSVTINNPQFANESKMMRAARDQQERARMRSGGRPF